MSATNTITPAVKFAIDPPLWPEMYTDLFKIDMNAPQEDLDAAIEDLDESISEKDMIYLYDVNFRLIYTDSQYVVSQLTELLHSFEIASQHTHFPNSYENG